MERLLASVYPTAHDFSGQELEIRRKSHNERAPASCDAFRGAERQKALRFAPSCASDCLVRPAYSCSRATSPASASWILTATDSRLETWPEAAWPRSSKAPAQASPTSSSSSSDWPRPCPRPGRVRSAQPLHLKARLDAGQCRLPRRCARINLRLQLSPPREKPGRSEYGSHLRRTAF